MASSNIDFDRTRFRKIAAAVAVGMAALGFASLLVGTLGVLPEGPWLSPVPGLILLIGSCAVALLARIMPSRAAREMRESKKARAKAAQKAQAPIKVRSHASQSVVYNPNDPLPSIEDAPIFSAHNVQSSDLFPEELLSFDEEEFHSVSNIDTSRIPNAWDNDSNQFALEEIERLKRAIEEDEQSHQEAMAALKRSRVENP